MDKEKKLLHVEIIRKDGKTFFSFEIDARIGKMYAKIANEERESVNWPGQKFYYCPELTESTEYTNRLYNYSLIDDYGAGLVKGNKFNIAWIRTVGGRGEIMLRSPLSMAELSNIMTNAKRFIREHWQNQLQNFKIVAEIKMQID